MHQLTRPGMKPCLRKHVKQVLTEQELQNKKMKVQKHKTGAGESSELDFCFQINRAIKMICSGTETLAEPQPPDAFLQGNLVSKSLS